MAFKPIDDRFVHKLEHSLAFPATPVPSASSPAPSPVGLFLSDVPGSFLQNSVSPRSVPEILEATSYDHEAGRKMITRMKMAGEVVSPARGLYTTFNHPSLANLTGDPLPVPIVPNVPTDPDIPSPSVPIVPSVPNPADTTGEVAHQHKDASQ